MMICFGGWVFIIASRLLVDRLRSWIGDATNGASSIIRVDEGDVLSRDEPEEVDEECDEECLGIGGLS